MKNPTEEMLRHIYIGAQSGCEAITGVLPKITDPELRRETTVQMEGYCAIRERAQALLREKDMREASFSLLNRLTVRGGVILETLGEPAQADLARMLRESSRDGVQCTRGAIAEYSGSGCDADVLALGQRMVAFETEEMKRLARLTAK